MEGRSPSPDIPEGDGDGFSFRDTAAQLAGEAAGRAAEASEPNPLSAFATDIAKHMLLQDTMRHGRSDFGSAGPDDADIRFEGRLADRAGMVWGDEFDAKLAQVKADIQAAGGAQAYLEALRGDNPS